MDIVIKNGSFLHKAVKFGSNGRSPTNICSVFWSLVRALLGVIGLAAGVLVATVVQALIVASFFIEPANGETSHLLFQFLGGVEIGLLAIFGYLKLSERHAQRSRIIRMEAYESVRGRIPYSMDTSHPLMKEFAELYEEKYGINVFDELTWDGYSWMRQVRDDGASVYDYLANREFERFMRLKNDELALAEIEKMTRTFASRSAMRAIKHDIKRRKGEKPRILNVFTAIAEGYRSWKEKTCTLVRYE